MNRRQVIISSTVILGIIALFYVMRNKQTVSVPQFVRSSGQLTERYIVEPTMTAVNRISQYGRNLLKQIESFSATPYPDAGGYSIGYGTYMGKTPTIQRVTVQEAENLLDRKLDTIHSTINNTVRIPLNQNQFDALSLLTYNIGESAFKSSTLARKLNSGDIQGAANEFDAWNKSTVNGVKKINLVLVTRRKTEKQLFLS